MMLQSGYFSWIKLFFVAFILNILLKRYQPMLPQERQRAILDIINQQGASRTQDLSTQFDVTVETIRRDLEMMHKEGLLVRTHGGAIARDHPTREQTARERGVIYLPEKQAIARRAVSSIQPRDIIFLDASSSVLQLTQFLPDLELTVITNSLDILEALEFRSDIKLVCTGGNYTAISRSFVGKAAVHTTRRYHIHKFFFSGNGIDVERGLSETSEGQAELKAELIPLAERSYFLSDASKTGHRAAYFFGKLEDIDCWITTEPENPAVLEPFRKFIFTIDVAPITSEKTILKSL